MTSPTAPLPVPPKTAPSAALEPGFLRTLRGVWIFTWRTQLAWRQIPLVILTLAAIPALVYFTLPEDGLNPFLHWCLDFYLFLVLPLYCLSTCGAMIRDELQADTLGFLLTRPLTRARLFAVKYISYMSWIQTMALGNWLGFYLVGQVSQIQKIHSFMFLFLPAQILAVLAYSALSGLFGLVHQRYMVLGIVYGFIVEMGISRIPTNINSLSMSHHLRTILANHSGVRELQNWTANDTWFSVLMLPAGTLVFLAASLALFTFREYHHSEEMQK